MKQGISVADVRDMFESLLMGFSPEWAAFVLALGTAAAQVTIAVRARRARSVAARRAQADQISVWIEEPDRGDHSSPSIVVVYNGSRHPIHAAAVEVVGTNTIDVPEHPAKVGRGHIVEHSTPRREEHEFRFAIIPPHESVRDALRIPIGFNGTHAAEVWLEASGLGLVTPLAAPPQIQQVYAKMTFGDHFGHGWHLRGADLRPTRSASVSLPDEDYPTYEVIPHPYALELERRQQEAEASPRP